MSDLSELISFTDFITNLKEGNIVPIEKLHKSVNIFDKNDTLATRGFQNAIGVLHQKESKGNDRVIIRASRDDETTFNIGIKKGDTIVRLTTKLSKPSSSLNQSIAVVNVIRGTVKFLTDESIEADEFRGWDKPDKLDFISIRKDDAFEFGIV